VLQNVSLIASPGCSGIAEDTCMMVVVLVTLLLGVLMMLVFVGVLMMLFFVGIIRTMIREMGRRQNHGSLLPLAFTGRYDA
jgi:hypothetical protein